MIGVVGPEAVAARLADAIEDTGASATIGDAAEIAEVEPTAVVAAGEPAVADVARAGVDVPVLPVDAGPAFETGDGSVVGVVERLLDGEVETQPYPVLDVRHGEEHGGRALFDVMLDTADPGRISEYGVRVDGRTDRFRADGVVVATPAGSRGYANAAGGPLLDPAVAAVAVVPIGAFELGVDRRVVEPPVTLTVERDECPVSLLVDGDDRGGVPPQRPVTVAHGGEIDVVSPRPGLEKL